MFNEPKILTRFTGHALHKRNPQKGLFLHSDRGSEFGSAELKEYTENTGVIRSMSRPYKSIDNAEVESFFRKLKGEYIAKKSYDTQKKLERLIASYINSLDLKVCCIFPGFSGMNIFSHFSSSCYEEVSTKTGELQSPVERLVS